MLLTEEQAKKIDQLLEKDDIKALEAVIRANTNNHFHRNGYKPLLVKLEGGKLYFQYHYEGTRNSKNPCFSCKDIWVKMMKG